MRVPLPATAIAATATTGTVFTKAVTLPRPQENVTPRVLLSTTGLSLSNPQLKQHLTIRASLSKNHTVRIHTWQRRRAAVYFGSPKTIRRPMILLS